MLVSARVGLIRHWYGRQEPLSSGCGRSPPVPLKISMTTPRSRSVPRYATLAPPNSPLRITPFPRSACATVSSKSGVATATWWTPSPCSARNARRRPRRRAARSAPTAPGRPWRRQGPGALDRLTVLAEILRFAGVELVNLPRADPVVVDVPPHRRREITHDDPELQYLVEDRLAHRPMGEPACRRRAPRVVCARRLRAAGHWLLARRKRLHTYRTFDAEQVGLNENAPISDAFAEPSGGLEPPTSSLRSPAGLSPLAVYVRRRTRTNSLGRRTA